jgi:hypothetical protein
VSCEEVRLFPLAEGNLDQASTDVVERNARQILALVIGGRIALQLLLVRAGFLALTADEFARMLLAERWSQAPFLVWQGAWLPFHMYLYGAALWLSDDIWLVGRLLAGMFGLASLVLMYLFTWRMLGSRRAGLMGALLLAVSPLHLWLSATPLTEISQTTFLLGFMLGMVLYWQKQQVRYLYLGAGALLLATGFRYEAWLAAGVFSLVLVGWGISLYRQRSLTLRGSAGLAGVVLVVWLFPLLWLAGNARASGDPLRFIQEVDLYKRTWYGSGSEFWPYWRALLDIDLPVFTLGLVGLVLLLVGRFCEWPVRAYVALAVIPFGLFIILHGGQPEPYANYLRYLSGFVFLLVPAAAYLLEKLALRVTQQRNLQNLLLAAALAGIAVLQLRSALDFRNDAAAAGLAVGREIARYQQQMAAPEHHAVLIELIYWDYLAVRTGAGEPYDLLYDRALDPARRTAESLLSTAPETFLECLASRQVGLVVVQSPQLRQFLESSWGWHPRQVINGYAFYPVSRDWLAKQAGDSLSENGQCPLEYNYPY